MFPGFQTGRGKKIEVSEESLEKGRAVLADEYNQYKDTSKTNDTRFPGFQTGCGKKIEVSEESLEKGRAVLADEYNQYKDTSKTNDTRFPGFQTEHGKNNKEQTVPVRTPEQKRSLKRELSDISDEELSPIINFRRRPRDELRSGDIKMSASVCKGLFGSNKQTPCGRVLPRDGDRNMSFGLSFHDGLDDRTLSTIFPSPDAGPSKKRTKMDFDEEECQTPDNIFGFTQEVHDLTKDFLADFEKSKLLEEDDSIFACNTMTPLLVDPAVLAAREDSRLHQLSQIRKNKLGVTRPSPGSLTRLRNSKIKKRISLWHNHVLGRPKHYTEIDLLSLNVHSSVINITPQNSLDFRFDGIEFFGEEVTLTNTNGFTVGDDVVLLLGYDCKVGVKEIANGFMCSPGVDTELISYEWVCNHFRWIVWTLASYEQKFPEQFGGVALTPKNVLTRLKYRYDREIDKSERSSLHRIIEQDDSPAKRMILFVSNIPTTPDNFLHSGMSSSEESSDNNETKTRPTLELSDGWYSIECNCDTTFMSFIEKGIVAVGTKLCLHSAELIASEPLHPLQAKGKALLKIGTNATRRAKWDCRLGFCENPGPFVVPLYSVKSEGGLVPFLRIIVARIYPMLYHCKSPDGKSIFYSEKNYEKIQRTKDLDRERHLELLYGDAQKEIEEKMNNNTARRSRRLVKPVKKDLDNMNTEDLLEVLEGSIDEASIERMLSKGQLERVRNARAEQMEKIQNSIQRLFELKVANLKDTEPDATPLLKIRLLDASVDPEEVHSTQNRATLSIWRPQEVLRSLLTEGSSFKLYAIQPSSPNNDFEKRLTASRATKYVPFLNENEDAIEITRRKCYAINEVLEMGFKPLFNEFDTIGLVVHIAAFVERNGQTVFIADEDENLLGIRLWSEISDQGLEEILKPLNCVAISNLQWRVSSRKNFVTTAYCQESSLFTPHPKEALLSQALANLKEAIGEDISNHAKICETKVTEKLSSNSHIKSFRRSI